MKLIKAYETPDKQRFFDEEEARKHERRYDYGNHVDLAVKARPEFARLDRELLLDFLMQHGSTIGKLADSPIKPEHNVVVTVKNPDPRVVASAFEKTPRFGHSGGVVGDPARDVRAAAEQMILDKMRVRTGPLPYPESVEGRRRAEAAHTTQMTVGHDYPGMVTREQAQRRAEAALGHDLAAALEREL